MYVDLTDLRTAARALLDALRAGGREATRGDLVMVGLYLYALGANGILRHEIAEAPPSYSDADVYGVYATRGGHQAIFSIHWSPDGDPPALVLTAIVPGGYFDCFWTFSYIGDNVFACRYDQQHSLFTLKQVLHLVPTLAKPAIA